MKLKQYVVGFAFSRDMQAIAMIQKKRVREGFEWMHGKFNGLGGMVEDGEEIKAAMSREFKEESGVHIPAEKWSLRGTYIKRCEYEVHVLKAVTDNVLDVFSAEPDEGFVCCIPYMHGQISSRRDVVPALKWLLPLILTDDVRAFRIIEK